LYEKANGSKRALIEVLVNNKSTSLLTKVIQYKKTVLKQALIEVPVCEKLSSLLPKFVNSNKNGSNMSSIRRA